MSNCPCRRKTPLSLHRQRLVNRASPVIRPGVPVAPDDPPSRSASTAALLVVRTPRAPCTPVVSLPSAPGTLLRAPPPPPFLPPARRPNPPRAVSGPPYPRGLRQRRRP